MFTLQLHDIIYCVCRLFCLFRTIDSFILMSLELLFKTIANCAIAIKRVIIKRNFICILQLRSMQLPVLYHHRIILSVHA